MTRENGWYRENLAMLLVPRNAASLWRVYCASVCLLIPWFSVFLFTCRDVSLARYFQVSTTFPAGRDDNSIFLSTSLPICFLGFYRILCFVSR